MKTSNPTDPSNFFSFSSLFGSDNLAVGSPAAILQCEYGSMPTPLMVLPSRTVVVESMLMGNIMDMAPLVNIIPFDTCSSPANPLVWILEGDAPCTPIVADPWSTTALTVLVQGIPALNHNSTVYCAYGEISITEPGNFSVFVP